MTDAKLSVTQSRLNAFAREYLNTLGASIRERGSRWSVRLPSHVDVEFGEGLEFDVVLGDDRVESNGEEEVVLSPGSEFAQRMLDEAVSMSSLSQVSVTGSITGDDYQYPDWITESDLHVSDASFNPYYDRSAVFLLVKISVETVSEYETQYLEAVTVDVTSEEELSGLPEVLLRSFYDPKTQPETEEANDFEATSELAADEFASVIPVGQRVALDNIRDEIGEVRETASRAADSEFEEYRQLQNQRLSDLRDELESVTDRLQRVSGDVDDADTHEERVSALQEREELQTEKDELEEKRAELLRKKQGEFEEKREEIFVRHSLDISTKPVASTVVSYERGEIELRLSDSHRTETMRAPYAAGVGCTDSVQCEQCLTELSADNPIQMGSTGLRCRSCR
ncbi:hypothetical protein [Halosimplex sp. J119]